MYAVRNHLLAGDVGDFAGAALLDRNLVAVGGCQVDGRKRSRHVERNGMFMGQHGNRIGSDFIGHIPVPGNAVGTHHDGSDFALLHDRARHIVGDDGGRNAIFHQLPRRQARALQEGTSLIGIDVDFLSLLDGGADHAEGGAISASGERAGIAVGQYSATGGHEPRTVAAYGLVSSDVFGMHAPGFFDERLLDLGHRADPQGFEAVAHAGDRPEQIHRGRAGLAEDIRNLFELGLQLTHRRGLGIFHAERDTHRGCDPNRGGAANHHVADHVRHLLMRLTEDVGFFRRQLRLVDEAYAGIGPLESLDHSLSR